MRAGHEGRALHLSRGVLDLRREAIAGHVREGFIEVGLVQPLRPLRRAVQRLPRRCEIRRVKPLLVAVVERENRLLEIFRVQGESDDIGQLRPRDARREEALPCGAVAVCGFWQRITLLVVDTP